MPTNFVQQIFPLFDKSNADARSVLVKSQCKLCSCTPYVDFVQCLADGDLLEAGRKW